MDAKKKSQLSLILFNEGSYQIMEEQKVMLIETIPAVKELRKVPGFNPLKFLRKTLQGNSDTPEFQLDLRYKRLWFRLACPNGRLLLNPLRITDQMAIFEARVFLSRDDELPIANYTVTQLAKDAPDGGYVKAAQDAALNVALDNAGFGIQLCDMSGAVEREDTPPVTVQQESRQEVQQTGVPVRQETPQEVSQAVATVRQELPQEPQQATTVIQQEVQQTPVHDATIGPEVETPQPVQDMQAVQPSDPVEERPSITSPTVGNIERPADTQETVPQTAPSAQSEAMTLLRSITEPEKAAAPVTSAPVQAEMDAPAVDAVSPKEEQPGYTEDMSVEEICARMTPEDAAKLVVPLGICKGWTMAQVVNDRPASLKWYAYGEKSSNILRAAALILLDDLQQKAG
jgi:hypothetical protein